MAQMVETCRLVLASDSPRRRQLLGEAGVRFDVLSPAVAEPARVSARASVGQQAEALAYFKARSVAARCPDELILAADTLVCVGGEILGKPRDADDARRMLRKLGGTRHEVVTGVAVGGPGSQRLLASDRTYVTMRRLSDQEIEDYIASGEWQGKAGAYAIQETADRFVTALEGSYSNVVGLPLELVERMLRTMRRRLGEDEVDG